MADDDVANDDQELRRAGDRIETLLAELAGEGPRTRARAEELVQLLLRLYGAGLERILSAIDAESGAEGSAADRIFARLAEDDLVASLLVLHDLHPLDLGSRIARALDRVRPHLSSHGGDVEILGVEDGVVRLRLLGSCDGCPSSSVTMKLAVERAIAEAAPEIVRIEVEGGERSAPGGATPPGLVSIGGEASAAIACPPGLVQIGGVRGGNGGNGVRAREAASSHDSTEGREWPARTAAAPISAS